MAKYYVDINLEGVADTIKLTATSDNELEYIWDCINNGETYASEFGANDGIGVYIDCKKVICATYREVESDDESDDEDDSQ